MRRTLVLLSGVLVLSACGSSAALKSAQSNKNVRQTETKVEQQVSRCMPSDPLLLARHGERVKFTACVGVAKNAKGFERCAVKVVLGGLPTVARLEKGLTACVEQNA